MNFPSLLGPDESSGGLSQSRLADYDIRVTCMNPQLKEEGSSKMQA